MESISIGSAQIYDPINQENGYVHVRIFGKKIGLCLSLEKDGDVELFMDSDQCKQIVGLLNDALMRME
jgi:hypothetical protein